MHIYVWLLACVNDQLIIYYPLQCVAVCCVRNRQICCRIHIYVWLLAQWSIDHLLHKQGVTHISQKRPTYMSKETYILHTHTHNQCVYCQSWCVHATEPCICLCQWSIDHLFFVSMINWSFNVNPCMCDSSHSLWCVWVLVCVTLCVCDSSFHIYVKLIIEQGLLAEWSIDHLLHKQGVTHICQSWCVWVLVCVALCVWDSSIITQS